MKTSKPKIKARKIVMSEDEKFVRTHRKIYEGGNQFYLLHNFIYVCYSKPISEITWKYIAKDTKDLLNHMNSIKQEIDLLVKIRNIFSCGQSQFDLISASICRADLQLEEIYAKGIIV